MNNRYRVVSFNSYFEFSSFDKLRDAKAYVLKTFTPFQVEIIKTKGENQWDDGKIMYKLYHNGKNFKKIVKVSKKKTDK